MIIPEPYPASQSPQLRSRPPLDCDLLIVGAGCAGLSLGGALQRRGYTGSVVIVDQRQDFTRDQRWCTWGPVDDSLKPLITHLWTDWQVLGDDQRSRFSTPHRPYVEFQAVKFLPRIAEEIAASQRFVLHLGTPVTTIRNYQTFAEVDTARGALRAKWVIDARGDGSESLSRKSAPGATLLWQSFVGFTVRTAASAFDPRTITLMDFRAPQEEHAEFFYVLPYSADCALVECTVVGPEILPLEAYRSRIQQYLSERGIGECVCDSEEIGVIPMTTQAFTPRPYGAVASLGIAAGAAKPSTGYAFARIQKQVNVVADSLMRGLPPSATHDPADRRRKLLDDVFLEVIARDPGQFRRSMLRMFRQLPPERVVRFLSEETTLAEDLSVMAAVGEASFVAPTMRRLRPIRPPSGHFPAP